MSSHAIAQTDETTATTTQPQEKITISFDLVEFTTLTSSFEHQAKAIVAYQTLDPNLIGTKINGVMEISKPDGTLIKYSSFPNGFDITESGRLQFASLVDDPQIDTLKLDVHLTNLGKTKIISNPISTTVSLDDVRNEYGSDAGAEEEYVYDPSS
ncbi:MAG: hypothetical protein WKF36_08665 [Candidatus Nitrosocosmicus sp.]